MRNLVLFCMSCVLAFLAGCNEELQMTAAEDQPTFVALDQRPGQLRKDFNAMTDKVRLLFIVGPSCAVCLRGMDDLDRAIVASLQDDARIHTFVVHVPTLGATEKHVEAAMPLMQGPRVSHYWDPSGDVGREYQVTLDIPMYAWDVWLLYDPGTRWGDQAKPPEPALWQHQLSSLPARPRLDPEAFADAVRQRLDGTPGSGGWQ